MKKASISTGLFALSLVLLYFVLELLSNYASTSIPELFQKFPLVLWGSIGVILCLIIVVTLLQLRHDPDNQVGYLGQHLGITDSPEMSDSEFDVFVSYSHKDAEWVQGMLIPRLKQHGFAVFSDRDFASGRFGIDQMEQGVAKSRRVLAVLSPSYLQSDWSKLENVMAQTLDPAAKQRKLIPVMYKPTPLPLRLQVIHYRNLTNNDDAEWERLVEDLV